MEDVLTDGDVVVENVVSSVRVLSCVRVLSQDKSGWQSGVDTSGR